MLACATLSRIAIMYAQHGNCHAIIMVFHAVWDYSHTGMWQKLFTRSGAISISESDHFDISLVENIKDEPLQVIRRFSGQLFSN